MKFWRSGLGACLVALTMSAAVREAGASLVVFEGTGANAGAIQATVDGYRSALGALNPNNPGSVGSGRREINWDGVPDNLADPNPFPGDFFNANVAGRARGAVFSTPGTGFLVSADNSNPTGTPGAFGFPTDLVPFSQQRLFAPVGSVITEINFFVPGTLVAATVSGFGAIFADVESAGLSTFEAFDLNGNSLFKRDVLVAGNGGLSFLGIQADAGERIARIVLTSGDAPLLGTGSTDGGTDLVALDDFIYAEPLAAVPEPSTIAGLAIGIVGAIGHCVRRRASR